MCTTWDNNNNIASKRKSHNLTTFHVRSKAEHGAEWPLKLVLTTRRHKNPSHSLVANIKTASSQQAGNIKRVETRPEAATFKNGGAKLEENLNEWPHQQEILLSYAIHNICRSETTAT